ncbi:MAG: hypothetical protein H5T63_05020 [Chloroflexi bacterium]|nr:hypothetical protein [Chloroflexota bacterium]
MRKIGYLLNQIRLHGEDKELIDEIVALSVRYGIMTPYTAFLVDESEDVLTRDGRERAAQKLHEETVKAAPTVSGPMAVERSIGQSALQESRIVATPQVEQVKHVADRAFIRRDGVWIDTAYDPARIKTRQIRFGSDAYFALLQMHPEWGKYFAVGQQVIVVLGGQAYEILAEGGEEAAPPTPTATPQSSLTATPTPTLRPAVVATPRPSTSSIWQRLLRWLRALLQ